MPVLTIRLSNEELQAAEQAARRHGFTKSEFARRAIAAAAEPKNKTAAIRGALKGKYSYREAMALIRG